MFSKWVSANFHLNYLNSNQIQVKQQVYGLNNLSQIYSAFLLFRYFQENDQIQLKNISEFWTFVVIQVILKYFLNFSKNISSNIQKKTDLSLSSYFSIQISIWSLKKRQSSKKLWKLPKRNNCTLVRFLSFH